MAENDSVPLTKLDPTTRCCAIVGLYLMHWGTMEAKLNESIRNGLKLTDLQGLVVCQNLHFKDKLNIVKSLLHVEFFKTKEQKHYGKLLRRIADLSIADRNAIAHDLFMPDDEGDGILFLTVKAKGPLRFPKNRWSITDVNTKCAELTKITKELKTLSSRMKEVKIEEFIAKSPANQGIGLLGLLGPHIPPFQGSPDLWNLDASPQTSPQTPEEIEE